MSYWHYYLMRAGILCVLAFIYGIFIAARNEAHRDKRRGPKDD